MTQQAYQPDYDPAEQAALYAAGLLPPEEADAFEDRLLAGDAACTREFERIRPAADMLLRAAPAIEPDLIVRSNLINSLGLSMQVPTFSKKDDAPDPFAANPGAMVLLRADNIAWQPTAVPGVVAKNLYVDRERNRATVLLRLDAGVAYPDHDHPDVEECLVLEGDLELGGKVMHRFDYMRIPKGGQHGTPRTRNGCLLLVTCGLVAA